MVERDRPEGPRRFSCLVLAVGVVVVLAGCSGRTTGATNIAKQSNGSVSAQLNAVGSCDQSCAAYMRSRVVGQSTWINAPAFNIPNPVNNAPWHQTATTLWPGATYEYQACGKESSWTQFFCAGPDGTGNTTGKFVAAAGSTDWLQFHYGPDHTGLNPFEVTIGPGNVGQLTTAWAAPTTPGGAIFSSPVVANGVVYVGSDDHKLYAFPATCGIGGATCSPLWTGITGGKVRWGPVVAGGVVYVGSDDGKLYAFPAAGCGAASCAPQWTASVPITSSPAVAGGVVYVGSGSSLFAFNAGGCGAASCSPLWTGSTAGTIYNSSPAVAHGVVYIGSTSSRFQGTLNAFNASGCGAATCSPLWTGTTGGAINSSPAVAGGVVFVGSDDPDDKLYAFSAAGCGAATCGPQWTGSASAIESSPAVAGGVVYVGSGYPNYKLYAFNAGGCGAASCSPLWTAPASFGTLFHSSPAVANGVIYIGSDDGKLYAFNASGCGAAACDPLWTGSQAAGQEILSSPTVAGGEVYVGTFGSISTDTYKLYAFSLP